MKSYASTAFTVYGGILADAATRWSNLDAKLGKDLSYLSKAVESRGLPFLTITLPSVAKSLLKWLDLEFMDTDEFPRGYPKCRKRPELFGEFFDMIFDDQGRLRPDVDIEAVKFLFQLLSCCKNIELECHPSRTKETLDEFYSIERNLPTSHPDTWDSDVPKWEPRHGHPIWGTRSCDPGDAEQALLDLDGLNGSNRSDLPWDDLRAYARKVTGGKIGAIPDWELEPKHGPGAVSEGLRGVKYDFPNWPTKLESRFPYDWYGSGSISGSGEESIDVDCWGDRPAQGRVDIPDRHERPSRLIAVPKSQKGPRLICAEPVAHQWIQQGIWRWLERRVEEDRELSASIRFRDQSLSRDRALSSSLGGELCTIDLSAASDRISTRLVEYLFQGSNLLDALHACRTRAMIQDLSDDLPKMVVLRKFSTMGSAVTFPVQTLVFWILVTWALKLTVEAPGYEGPDWTSADVTIFGDDIIAPTVAYPTIELVLHECGLKVNNSKTFTGKNFRESCGMYAFRGVDITPAYYLRPYDGSPDALAATIEMSNSFHACGYWKTAQLIVDQLPDAERKKLYVKRIPKKGSQDTDGVGGFGLASFCGAGFHLHKRVWDSDLHRYYVKVLSVSSKAQVTKGRGEHSLSQYFFEEPNPELPWESGRASVVKQRKRLTRVYG
nr:MAG: hypothetical protein 3 [Leviviridae sp.]